MTSSLDVVVPTLGAPALTWRCISNLYLFGVPGMRVVLVDDGTMDYARREGVGHMREEAEQLRFIGQWVESKGGLFFSHSTNRGPHAAWNTGWNLSGRGADGRASTSATVAFVNNDVVVGPGCLRLLLSAIARGEHYACARELQAEGVDFAPGYLLAHAHDYDYGDGGPRLRRGDHFNACFAVRRAGLEDLCGFDESMRLAYADTDFLERMRDHGREPCVVENAVAFHGVSVTRRRVLGPEMDLALEDKDRTRFEEKWAGRPDVLARHPRVSGDLGLRAREVSWKRGEPL